MQTSLSISSIGSVSLFRQQASAVSFGQKLTLSNCDGGVVSMRIRHQRWLLNKISVAAASANVTVSADPTLGTNLEIWKNHCLSYEDPGYEPVTANVAVKKEHEKLKEEVRRMLMKIQTTPITSTSMMPLKDRVRFIDTLYRLGVSLHFEREIGNIMQRIYEFDNFSGSNDLYIVATTFRLLREQGIHVPATGLFDKFLDQIEQQNEEASSSSVEDIDGLLALYEASYYSIPEEEDILDRAQELTLNKLKAILPQLKKNNHQVIESKKVEHVLYRSIRRNLDRLSARFYISIYKQELTFGELLLKFAVHDYNIRQASFQKDLNSLTRWSEDLKKAVPFARHRILETYFWALCLHTEPQYDFSRIMITKFAFTMYLIDDAYESCGTSEELELFTEAFAKLDPNASPQLSPHMKAIIGAMKELYAEVEKHHPAAKPYLTYYLRREDERLFRAYEMDARWINTDTIPTYDQYFDVAMTTAGMTKFTCMSFIGTGEAVSEQALSCTLDNPIPQVVKAAGIICRCLDDLSFELNEVDKPQSAVAVFMKHYGVSQKEARQMVGQLVSNAYKEINKGLLIDNHGIPKPILKALLGHAQANDIINRDQGVFNTHDRLKEIFSSLFVDPVSM